MIEYIIIHAQCTPILGHVVDMHVCMLVNEQCIDDVKTKACTHNVILFLFIVHVSYLMSTSYDINRQFKCKHSM